MIVAVSVVRMVQVPVDDVVHMITMGYGFVAAFATVGMLCIVPLTGVAIRAVRGVRGRHLKLVLVDVAFMRVMHVTVVQKVSVAVMLNSGMPTFGAMLVVVICMDCVVGCHDDSLSKARLGSDSLDG